jgi:hypothetical protein
MTERMRVIVFAEGDRWVAQALEHDICATAASVPELKTVFSVTVDLEEQEPGGLARIGAAPDSFFAMWDAANGTRPSMMLGDGMIEMKLAA